MVKPAGQLACELEVLGLVLAHRNVRRVVEQDVGGLQDRVREEAEFEGIFVVCRVERRGV
jgi:hypothetical protein